MKPTYYLGILNYSIKGMGHGDGMGHGNGSFVPLCKQIPINCLPTMNGDEVRRGEDAPKGPNNQNFG